MPGLGKPCPGHSPGSMIGGGYPCLCPRLQPLLSLWKTPMAPTTRGRVKKGLGMAQPGGHLGSFLNVIPRSLSGPGVHKHPIYFHSHSSAPPISIPTPTTPESICPVPGSLPTPLSLCVLSGPAQGTSLRKPHNRQQSLFPIWHLGGSKAHLHPAGGLLGQVALCSTWPGGGGDSNIDTWFWP